MWSHSGIVCLNMLYVLPNPLFLISFSIIPFGNFIRVFYVSLDPEQPISSSKSWLGLLPWF